MKGLVCAAALACFFRTAMATGTDPYEQIPHLEALKGITHYGMPIEQKVRSYIKAKSILEIVYSQDLSDDNMDKYVQRFYDEVLRRIEQRLYARNLAAKKVRIVISNCKFCKVGYCKTKKVKEITLTSYRDGFEYRQMSLNHQSLLQSSEVTRLARKAVMLLID